MKRNRHTGLRAFRVLSGSRELILNILKFLCFIALKVDRKKLADYKEGRGQSKAYILMHYWVFFRLEQTGSKPRAQVFESRTSD